MNPIELLLLLYYLIQLYGNVHRSTKKAGQNKAS